VNKPLQEPPTSASIGAAYAGYVRQLEQQEVTHESMSLVGFEYQAKARSRQLDTLLHLSHFSDYLVLVSAPSGAGKTIFIEQFLRVQPADACIVHLVLHEPVTAPWVVRQLVQQLPIQLANHAGLEASILALQELAQELALQKEVLLILVDDAQWLDEDALELLANLLPRSAKVDSRPHVVLCADHSVVERIEGPQFAELRQERFYHLVLAPFSQEESADYLRQRLQRAGINHGLGPIQLLQLHQLAKGNPGYLNMLANKALHKGGVAQQTGLPLLHIGATVFVVAILAAIWWLNDTSTHDAGQNEVESDLVVVQSIITEPMAQALPPLEPIELSPAPKNVSLEPKPEPEPEPEPELELQPEPIIEPKVEVNVEPEVEVKPKPKPKPKAELKPEKQTATIVSKPVLEAWPKVTSKTKQPYSYEAMLKLPGNHYSLQVLGARLETTIEAFLEENKVKKPHYVIKLERGGEPWYMLLVGDYASASEARGAISSLPITLKNQQPWARPVLKIQQQIRNKFNTSGE
jgi:DamX protein